MTTSTELVATEQPQHLITIEPAKYVALVFDNHRTRADAYKAEAPTVTYDITTTAGMKTAVEWRAKGRDIRVEVTDIHKERKAPILEIGRLMDARKKEIIADVEPDEDRFDRDIKAETARKEAEKAAKFAAEQARVAAIRQKIDVMRNRPAAMVGRPSDEISAAADVLSETVISLEEFAEFAGEGQVERNAAVTKLRDMRAAQLAHEQAAIEAARQAELDRIERERVAEENRLEAKRLADLAAAMEVEAQLARDRQALADKQAREKREAAEAEQRAANERAAAAMRAEQAQHEARMREQQAAADKMNAAMSEIQGIQQQVIIAQSGRLGVRKGGTIECLRETLAETEAWELDPERFGILAGAAESAKTTAVAEIRRLLGEAEARVAAEAAAKLEADHAEALEENARIDAERAAAFEAQQQEAQRRADEAERIRREQVQFIINGPGDIEIVRVIAEHYDVELGDAMEWLKKFDYAAADEHFAAANVAANRMERAA